MPHAQRREPDSRRNIRAEHDRKRKRDEKPRSGRAGASRGIERRESASQKLERKAEGRNSAESSRRALGETILTPEEKAEASREWRQQSEILFELMRVEELLGSNVLSPVRTRETLFWSAIIEILILLRDLSQRARDIDAKHLTWSDDIIPAPKLYSDIFELIRFCRDGLCHTHTFHATLDPRNNRLARGVTTGKGVMMGSTDGSLSLSCDYEDEVAIFVGAHRLYLKRHIVRAWRELRQIFVDAGKLEESNGRLYPKPPSLPVRHSTKE